MRKMMLRTFAVALLVCMVFSTSALAAESWENLYRQTVGKVFQNAAQNYYIGLVSVRGDSTPPVLMLGRRSGTKYYIDQYYIQTNGKLRKSSHNIISLDHNVESVIVSTVLMRPNGARNVFINIAGYTSSSNTTFIDRVLRVTQNSKRVLDVPELFRTTYSTNGSNKKYYVKKKKVSKSKYEQQWNAFYDKYGECIDGKEMLGVDSLDNALEFFEMDLAGEGLPSIEEEEF